MENSRFSPLVLHPCFSPGFCISSSKAVSVHPKCQQQLLLQDIKIAEIPPRMLALHATLQGFTSMVQPVLEHCYILEDRKWDKH